MIIQNKIKNKLYNQIWTKGTPFEDEEEIEVTKWAGYPTTDGVPDEPSGAWGDYTNTADREYGRDWTATENGTATHVNIRWATQISTGPFGAFLFLYNNGTKVGQIAIDPLTAGANSWTGDIALVETSPGSLDFSSLDILVFGMAFDGSGSLCGLKKDDGNGGPGAQFASGIVDASGPPASVSFSTSGINTDIAAIVKYTTTT